MKNPKIIIEMVKEKDAPKFNIIYENGNYEERITMLLNAVINFIYSSTEENEDIRVQLKDIFIKNIEKEFFNKKQKYIKIRSN